jgi:hypothetical protein
VSPRASFSAVNEGSSSARPFSVRLIVLGATLP